MHTSEIIGSNKKKNKYIDKYKGTLILPDFDKTGNFITKKEERESSTLASPPCLSPAQLLVKSHVIHQVDIPHDKRI